MAPTRAALALVALTAAACPAHGAREQAMAVPAWTDAAPARWVKLPRTDLPWLQPLVPRVGDCGDDKPVACNVTWLQQQCEATTGCNAFNTNGFLKACPGGYCDCGSSSDACPRAMPTTDTWVKAGRPPPAAWQAAVANASMLYADPEPPLCYSPEVGNGYLATVAGWGALYVGGLYNGRCGSVHRARLPSPAALRPTGAGAALRGSALDMRRAMYLRRWVLAVAPGHAGDKADAGTGADAGAGVGLGAGTGTATVEQRLYAHRTQRHLLVTEFEVVAVDAPATTAAGAAAGGAAAAGQLQVSVPLRTLWNPLNQSGHGEPGDGCAGGFKVDIAFTRATPPPPSPPPPRPLSRSPSARASAHATRAGGSGGGGGSGSAEAWAGHTLSAGDEGEIFNVSVVMDAVPALLTMPAAVGSSRRFIASVATSLDVAPRGAGDPAAVLALAGAAYWQGTAMGPEALMAQHVSTWAELWTSGVDVEGEAEADPPAGAGGGEDVAAVAKPAAADTAAAPAAAADDGAAAPASQVSQAAAEVARHANSSQYFLLSSVRDDWTGNSGVSPGGLSTANYQGAVFMDMDWWMLPPLRLLYPAGAAAVLQYRFNSLNASRQLARLFGYPTLPGAEPVPEAQAAMLAWTAAYLGRPFGCCGGHGGYEDCLEQHITGDTATAAWWQWLVTRDHSWLGSIGWPMLRGFAEFWLARVTPRPPVNATAAAASGAAGVAGAAGAVRGLQLAANYSIRGVLPIDEWCVGSGCGCETPGIDDDAHTNAVATLSLRYAAAAAQELGVATPRTALYAAVAERILVPWDSSHASAPRGAPGPASAASAAAAGPAAGAASESAGAPLPWRHNQWGSGSGERCPGGVGGSHYSPQHTVCPEDVMLLSYPMGEALAVPLQVTRADAERFINITCEENAGMTTPIHAIAWLDLGEAEAAQAAFNRSLRAACYGPFNVRNEVDKHPDIVGGHFDNTHFLTGDGGHLQALMNGYGRLRVAEDGGLWLRAPVALPLGVARLRLRSLQWRGGAVRLDVCVQRNAPRTMRHAHAPNAFLREPARRGSGSDATGPAGAHRGEGAAGELSLLLRVVGVEDGGAVCVLDAAGRRYKLAAGHSATFAGPAAFPVKVLPTCVAAAA